MQSVDRDCPFCTRDTLVRHDGDEWCTGDDCTYLLEDVKESGVTDEYPVPAPDTERAVDE